MNPFLGSERTIKQTHSKIVACSWLVWLRCCSHLDGLEEVFEFMFFQFLVEKKTMS